MRYLYVISVVGEAVAKHMLDKGVEHHYVEAWLLHWEDLLARCGRALPGQTTALASDFAAALKASMWYMGRKDGDE